VEGLVNFRVCWRKKTKLFFEVHVMVNTLIILDC